MPSNIFSSKDVLPSKGKYVMPSNDILQRTDVLLSKDIFSSKDDLPSRRFAK